MAHEVYYQFFQTPEQVRRIGGRGGQATARNRRERRDGPSPGPAAAETETSAALPSETTAAAIALLDTQFPWLRGAEARFLKRTSPASARTEP